MHYWAEIRDTLQGWLRDYREWRRIKADEPRLWLYNDTLTGTPRYHLTETTCEPQLDRILVHFGLVESRNEAQKAIKAGSVKFRDLYEFAEKSDGWHRGLIQVATLKTVLPRDTAIQIRYGKQTWKWPVVVIPEYSKHMLEFQKLINDQDGVF